MSLRKPGSANSATPFRKDMEAFQSKSYNTDQHNNNNGDAILNQHFTIAVPSNTRSRSNSGGEDNGEDDYDSAKKHKRPSPPSGNTAATILRAIPNSLLPASSASNNSLEQQQYQQQQQPQPQFSMQQQPQFAIQPPNNHAPQNPTISQNSPSSLPPPFVIQVTAIASLGGVLFGYDMGVIAGALPQLETTFDLTDNQAELVVSILYVGGGLGAAFGGSICDFLGRKPAILWTDITFMVGAAVLFTAPSVNAVCVGRVIVGFAVAVSGIADVSYLHEIAPTQWRGAIVSVNEACISLGFLLAFVVGTVLAEETGDKQQDNEGNTAPPRGWRYMFGLGGVMALIQFLGMWSMPESPVWLKEQGRHDESKAALHRINGGEPVPVPVAMDDNLSIEDDENFPDDERDGIFRERNNKSPLRCPQEVAIECKTSYESLASHPGGTAATTSLGPSNGIIRHRCCRLLQTVPQAWRKLKQVLGKYRRQVWIALFLSVTQQFCGQTSVLNYAPTILRAVIKQDNANGGGDGNDQVSGSATLSIGLVKFIATLLVIWKIEKIGRRTLLLMGMGTIAFGLLLVAVAFSSTSQYLRDQNGGTDDIVQSGSGFYFALPGVLLVVSGYSMSFGPLTWLLTSELFPTDIRGRALGASTIVTYLCAAMVTYSFLTAQALMGTSTVFIGYMVITLVGMVFAALAIPDTGDKTLEEIDTELSKMPWWRRFNGSSSTINAEPKRRRRRSSSSHSGISDSSNGMGDNTGISGPSILMRPNSSGRLIVESELT